MSDFFKQQLQKSFNEEIRKSYSTGILNAYEFAWENSLEFGSFSQQAYPFLRYFYCEHLIQMASERHKLSCALRDNEIRNHKHLCIESENLFLTIHHLDKNSVLPRKANYRVVYKGLNDDLFTDLNNENHLSSDKAHVYLLHEGWKDLEKIFFAFPSASKGLFYSEPLEIQRENLVEEEDTPSTIKEGIKLKVEEHIRKTGSK